MLRHLRATRDLSLLNIGSAWRKQHRQLHEQQIHEYEGQKIGVFRLPSYADIRYGIHLKQTDEYGVYSFFVHDDGKVSSRYTSRLLKKSFCELVGV